MKNYLLSGSLAYDSILIHHGAFAAKILPTDISRLNVAFGVDEHQEEFGGCGGNISYNAAYLGDSPLLVGTVGRDFQPYALHLQTAGVGLDSLQTVNLPTAHAWILTDSHNNQIAAFSQGAMATPLNPIDAWFDPSIALWHIAPESPVNMSRLAHIATENNIPYFLDPGQCLPILMEDHPEYACSFMDMVTHATGLFVNDYESALLLQKMELHSLSGLFTVSRLQFIVHTQGASGLHLLRPLQDPVFVPACTPDAVVDPTGCGDALRAGFLHGYIRDWDLVDCSKMGSAMGSLAVERSGGQNHRVSAARAMQRAGLTT